MKQSYYFSHDNNAYNDERIVDLRIKHGIAGYGVYWAILEQLHQSGGKMEKDIKRLAFALQLNSKLVASVLQEFGLFEFEDNLFYSKRMLEHFEKRKTISKKRSEAGRKGGLSSSKQANAKQMLSKGEAKSSKGKERKGNKRKENKGNKRKSLVSADGFFSSFKKIDSKRVVSKAEEYDIRPKDVIYFAEQMHQWSLSKEVEDNTWMWWDGCFNKWIHKAIYQFKERNTISDRAKKQKKKQTKEDQKITQVKLIEDDS